MRPALLLAATLCAVATAMPARAIDPPYQAEMERLSEILGSLYFLQPLCGQNEADWRQQVGELIALDEPDEDRRQRLAGAFNGGFGAYARLYRTCTPSAEEAVTRLIIEAERIARDLHSRYAE